jgi:hypothetical protein
VCFDNRAADRQPQAQPLRLGRIEGLEQPVETLRVQARPGIAHGDQDARRRIRLGPHHDLARPVAHTTQGFEGVDE